MLLIGLIDKFIPTAENPHEMRSVESMENENQAKNFRKLYKMGMMTALAVGIHNFPEGIATFMSALKDPTLGIAIAIAISIHNIPEGIAVSVPIFMPLETGERPFSSPFCQDFLNLWVLCWPIWCCCRFLRPTVLRLFSPL